MSVATSIEVRQFGLALEAVRGTPLAAPTKFLSCTKESDIDFSTKLLPDPALRGYNARFASFAGAQEGKGPFKTPLRASEAYYWFKMLFGAPGATEQASYVINSSNNKLDFNIGASQLTATIASSTYIAGTNQATAASLCKAIYDAIVAAEAVGTYTVSYAQATGLFTITRSAGTFVLMWNTGTNTAASIAATIGFSTAANSTGALTYSSGSAAYAVFKFAFTQGSTIQLPSYSFYIHRGMNDASGNPRKVYNMGQVMKLKLSGKDDSPVELDASLVAQLEATYGGAWSYSISESAALMFSGTTIKVAGSSPSVPNIGAWDVELDPGLKPYRPHSQQQYPYDFLAAGPFKAKGGMSIYFMDETERAKFIADTITSLEFIMVGGQVGGSSNNKYTAELNLPQVEYEAFPYGDENGFLGAKVKFGGVGAFSGSFQPAATAYIISQTPPGS